VTPRDEEMRPSGTLKSTTTGSLEAMLREADREEQLAEYRAQQKNVTAKVTDVPSPPSAPSVFGNNPVTVAQNSAATDVAPAPATTGAVADNVPAAKDAAVPAANTPSTTTGNQVALNTEKPAEEMPAFVPAPKSLVSSTSANEVAAVNTNLSSDARASLTSLTAKPIEASISTRVRTAQLSLTPTEQSMKVGESRRFALDVKSDAPLALAIIALRFDPKVVKVRAVGLETGGATFTQSTDASGVCLISISSMTGSGNLLYIDVEGVGLGDAGLQLDRDSTHLVATDARDLGIVLVPVIATVKQ
jgi:hypothetical protein